MSDIPPLPPGFQLDSQGSVPPLPPGFTLDQPQSNAQPVQQKRGWRDILFDAGQQADQALGKATRYVVEGVTAPFALAATPINSAFGMENPSQAVSGLLTRAGLPEPQGAQERVVADISRSLAGTGGVIKLGNTLANSAGPVMSYVGNALRSNPGMQAASATTGAASAGATREAGGGPGAQFAAGIVGGLAPPIVGTGTQLLTTVTKNAARPITKAGQNQIASDILKSSADDPITAARNLRSAQEVIPGSLRTTGEASKDVGLLALEKGVRGKNPGDFGTRASEQNSARQAALSKLSGTKSDIAAEQAARDAQTGPMRDAALKRAGKVKVSQVQDTIDSLLTTPAGKRETISSVLKWAKETVGDEVDAATLYEKRKDLQFAMQGKLQPSSDKAPNASTLALARKELGLVVKSLDDQIEASAPGFKAYLKRYADLSKPIDQKKILQEIRQRSQLQSMDMTTQEQFLGPAKFGQAVDSVLLKNEGKLTAQQLEQLNAIRTDLQYGQAINGPLIKAPGSDTFQNLSIAQVIGSGSSPAHPALRIIGKPLQWIYKIGGSDEAVNQLLADAMLDPKLAAQMLERATPQSVNSFASRLIGKARGGVLGAQAQLIVNQAQKPKDKSTPSEPKGAGK